MKGLSSEVPLGPENGFDHDCAVALDKVLTISSHALGRTIGLLLPHQERDLAMAMVRAYDLELPVLR